MTKIRPLGSCRLLTPLKNVREHYGIRLDMQGQYGFTHTSAQALQQLRHVLGELTFPNEFLQLIARPKQQLAAKAEGQAEGAEAFIVEVSSLKRIRIDGYEAQLNYVAQVFDAFFSDKQRAAQFWRDSAPEGHGRRQEWLETDDAYRAMPEDLREMLCRIEMTMMDKSEVADDLAAIRDLIGERPLIVQTHVNARAANGAPLRSRTATIRAVNSAAKSLGLPVFDPSTLMRTVGQDSAMERHGADTTHFVPAFSDMVGKALCEDYLFPALGRPLPDESLGTEGASRGLAQLREASDDQLVAISQQAFSLLRSDSESSQNRRLAGHVLHRLGDHGRARDFLEELFESGNATQEDMTALAGCELALENPTRALEIGRALLDEEAYSPAILKICAQSAEAADPDAAQAYWQGILQHGDGLAVASKITQSLPGERDTFPSLWRAADELSDPTELIGLAAIAEGERPKNLSTLLEEALERNRFLSAGLLVAVLRKINASWEKEPDLETVREWATTAQEKLDDGEIEDALARMRGAKLAYGRDRLILRLEEQFARALRLHARQAWSKHQYEQVVRLGNLAKLFEQPFPERERYLGLALYRLERHADAIGPLREAAWDPEPSPIVLLSLARSAAKAERPLEEVEAFQRADDLDDPPEKLIALRDRRFAGAARKLARLVLIAARERNLEFLHPGARLLLANEEAFETNQATMKRILAACRALLKHPHISAQQRAEIANLISEISPEKIIEDRGEEAVTTSA